MDRLLCTSLYRALLKSLTRKAVSENRLRNYFHDFAQQAMTICDNTDALSALRILNYTQVKFRSLLRRVSERDTPPPHYLSRFINQAIEFIRTETDLLYYRLEHPQHFISEPVPQSPLHWSKKYHAVDLSEILCSFDLMSPRPIILSDGREAPVLSGYSAFRTISECQTRKSGRHQTPCSRTQKRSHEVYRSNIPYPERR